MSEHERLVELLQDWGNKENDGVRAESIADYLLENDERPANKALEKQIPKKGIMIGDNYSSVLSCPKCRNPIVNVWDIAKYEPNYCHYCGQALDWSDSE
nr:MAG TPA: LysW biosynthesis protein LysW [Caudoviricetes sp.]